MPILIQFLLSFAVQLTGIVSTVNISFFCFGIGIPIHPRTCKLEENYSLLAVVSYPQTAKYGTFDEISLCGADLAGADLVRNLRKWCGFRVVRCGFGAVRCGNGASRPAVRISAARNRTRDANDKRYVPIAVESHVKIVATTRFWFAYAPKSLENRESVIFRY